MGLGLCLCFGLGLGSGVGLGLGLGSKFESKCGFWSGSVFRGGWAGRGRGGREH